MGSPRAISPLDLPACGVDFASAPSTAFKLIQRLTQQNSSSSRESIQKTTYLNRRRLFLAPQLIPESMANMESPRTSLVFAPQKNLNGKVVLYTAVGRPIEGPIPDAFPERSFSSIDDLERAMAPTIAPAVLALIRKALENETKFVLEVGAEQALAINLSAQTG